jgi:nucleolar protein 16
VGERWYLERLAKKYGDDMHKMALDRRLNPEQKTIGELKRAITKAGGLGVLRGDTS